MSYVVLARKWRPMSFEDLIGQSHVSRTLGNAIQSGRVAHAFLFTGVRGVGKTTSARILAKALNCTGTADEPHAGPTVTPCLQCAPCREITAGTDVDVREIDGASYNGVDEVRKLQDSLPYRPARDRFKIFIVDEVHMLSQSAWNAFLKTLEEPPPHVKFIFATTEVHKVPITILSRVQRFDFKLIPTQLIAKRLKHVLTSEGISTDDRALSIIAREAAGSMRDAMSLLDQVIAWNDQALDGDSVARVLGVASHQILHDLASALVASDAATCLRITSELANQGYDIASVTKDVLAVLRDLVVAKTCEDPSELLDLADEEQRDVQALAARTSADDLIRLHQGFSAGFDDVVRSGQARAALEMLLVRLARRPALIPIDDLVARLAALEKRLGGGPRGGSSAPATGSGSPAPRGGAPTTGNRGGFSPAEARPAPPPETRPQGREGRPTSPGPRPAPLADPAEEPPRAPAKAVAEPAGSTGPADAPADPPPLPPPARAPSEKVATEPGARRAVVDPPILVEWRAIVDRVRADAPQLAAFLHHASILELGTDRVVIAFEPGTVFEKSARAADSVELIRKAAAAHLGGSPALVFETMTRGAATKTVAAVENRERSERQREAVARAKEHPKVAEVVQILGARLKEIRLPDE